MPALWLPPANHHRRLANPLTFHNSTLCSTHTPQPGPKHITMRDSCTGSTAKCRQPPRCTRQSALRRALAAKIHDTGRPKPNLVAKQQRQSVIHQSESDSKAAPGSACAPHAPGNTFATKLKAYSKQIVNFGRGRTASNTPGLRPPTTCKRLLQKQFSAKMRSGLMFRSNDGQGQVDRCASNFAKIWLMALTLQRRQGAVLQ